MESQFFFSFKQPSEVIQKTFLKVVYEVNSTAFQAAPTTRF
jgi:hypothetical protein